MAPIDDAVTQWLARSLAWDRRLAELRESERIRIEAAAARPERPAQPVDLREPARAPIDRRRERIPHRDHRVA